MLFNAHSAVEAIVLDSLYCQMGMYLSVARTAVEYYQWRLY